MGCAPRRIDFEYLSRAPAGSVDSKSAPARLDTSAARHADEWPGHDPIRHALGLDLACPYGGFDRGGDE